MAPKIAMGMVRQPQLWEMSEKVARKLVTAEIHSHDEQPPPTCKAVHTVEIGVAGRLEVASEHGSQRTGNVEER